jgi:hypothetical protein
MRLDGSVSATTWLAIYPHVDWFPANKSCFRFFGAWFPWAWERAPSGSTEIQWAQLRASERATKQLMCWSSIYSFGQPNKRVLHTDTTCLSHLSPVRRSKPGSPDHRTNQALGVSSTKQHSPWPPSSISSQVSQCLGVPWRFGARALLHLWLSLVTQLGASQPASLLCGCV